MMQPYQSGHFYPNITVNDNAQVIAGNVNLYHENIGQKQTQECYQAFKTSTYEEFKDRNPARDDGTCQWVLTHPHYQQWRQSEHDDLLWISADPGCGKSVLAKSLVDRDLNDGQSTICYFFFKDNEEQDNIAAALCALLHQLFTQQPGLIRHALPSWKENGKMLQREAGVMWHILRHSAMDATARPVICVLDALDECRDQDRKSIISFLCSLYTQSKHLGSTNQFKILATSRPYDNVQRWFADTTSQWPNIRLRGEDENEQVHQEINLVINRQVGSLAKEFCLSCSSQKRLELQLLSMQHRTYLWLDLAMEEIRDVLRSSLYPDAVVIDSLPPSVEDAYERLLQKITKPQRATARLILLVIVGARRPLKIGELARALAAAKAYETTSLEVPNTAHLERQIRLWCGLFVFIQHSTLFLIHQTAKEFLLSEGRECPRNPSVWRGCLTPFEVELAMLKLCTSYLTLTRHPCPRSYNIAQYPRHHVNIKHGAIIPHIVDKRDEFSGYCAENWPSYLLDQMITDDAVLLGKILAMYDLNSDLFHSWYTFLYPVASHVKNTQHEHVIARNGHEYVMVHLYSRGQYDIKVRGNRGVTALHVAVEHNHLHIVKWLLEKGADINATQEDNITALEIASKNDYVGMLRLLIKAGANVNDMPRLGNALHFASERGYTETSQILIDAGTDVDAKTSFDATALYLASRGGYVRIVKMLLGAGADINITNDDGKTAILHASERGHAGVVRMLIEAGANLNIQDQGSDTALHLASKGGSAEIVRLLVEAGANLNIKDQRSNTALHLASKGGNTKIVRLLVEAGADLDIADSWLNTALHLASKKGNTEIVRLLIEAGANLDIRGQWSDTALHIAWEYSNAKIVHLLLQAGADTDIMDCKGRTALHRASDRDRVKGIRLLIEAGRAVASEIIVWYLTLLGSAMVNDHTDLTCMLVKAGAHVNMEIEGWGTLLHRALYNGDVQVAKALIEAGADINVVNVNWGAVLHIVSRRGDVQIIKILITAGANIDLRDRYGRTAIFYASERGLVETVRILIGAGASLDIADFHGGETALSYATFKRKKEIVRMLVRAGADVNLVYAGDATALHHASRSDCTETALILLGSGANADIKDCRGYTALHYASAGGCNEMVRTLIDAGADVDIKDLKGYTALQYASRRGRAEIVRTLIQGGADVDVEDCQGYTALSLARMLNREKVVWVLEEHKAPTISSRRRVFPPRKRRRIG